MISVELEEKPDSKWDARLLGTKYGTIYQSSSVAKYHNKSANWESKFLTFTNNKGTIVGQLLLEFQPRFQKSSIRNILLTKFPFVPNFILRWSYGPIIFDPNYEQDVKKTLAEYLLKHKGPIIGHVHPLYPDFLPDLVQKLKISSQGTFLLDLSLGKEVLWNNTHKNSCRKNIERSKERGVSIKQMTSNDLEVYYQMLKESDESKMHLEFSDTKIQWQELSKLGFTGFLAFHEQIPVAGLLVSFFNGYLNEWGVARTKYDYNEKLYSQDLIKWSIIEWGIEQKFRYFDLSGVNPNPTTEKEKGIYKFKEKWGGKLILYNKITR
ncbi:MAG: hypothetical protein ACREA8_11410 [Nitrosotalea sp.]